MKSEIATMEDADALAVLVNAAYRGAGGRLGWTHEDGLIAGDRATAKEIAALIGGGSATVMVRRGDPPSALRGCIAVEINGGGRCTLSMLAVDPELQTSGLGRALLADAEAFAAAKGVRTAKMTVVQQRESLIAWYERRGYRRTGALEGFAYGDDSVGKPLRDDLRFVVLEKAL